MGEAGDERSEDLDAKQKGKVTEAEEDVRPGDKKGKGDATLEDSEAEQKTKGKDKQEGGDERSEELDAKQKGKVTEAEEDVRPGDKKGKDDASLEDSEAEQ